MRWLIKDRSAVSFSRRSLLVGTAGALVAAAGLMSHGFAQSERFPDRPLRIVVPYAAGGTADILGRLLADRLSQELGQSVVVENRVGAGTAIATRYVATAPADGYTLMIGTATSHAMNPALQPDIGYDPIKSFTALSAISDIPFAIVANPKQGFQSLKDLVERARAEPGKLSYGSAGMGSSNHLGVELLSQKEKLKFIHVPYRGSAPALNDVIAGQTNFMFDLVTTAQPHLKSGTLSVLATTGAERSPVLPDVPTAAEAGVPGLQITAWFGVFAPANLPAPVQKRLSDAIAKVLAEPAMQERLKAQGGTPLPLRDEAFRAFVEKDYNQWSELIRSSNIVPATASK